MPLAANTYYGFCLVKRNRFAGLGFEVKVAKLFHDFSVFVKEDEPLQNSGRKPHFNARD